MPAGAGEVGGGKGVLGDGRDEEGEAGRPGHWTAMMGTGRAWASVAQNKSEGPGRERKNYNISFNEGCCKPYFENIK